MLETHDPRAITTAALTSALLAEADAGHPQSFHRTLSQHRAVLDSMSAHEAQQLFLAALSHLRQQSEGDMMVLAKVAWQVAASRDLRSEADGQMAAEQLQQLVEVYLSCGQPQQALAVRVFADVPLGTKPCANAHVSKHLRHLCLLVCWLLLPW